MFLAEFLICLATGQCLVYQEAKPVMFRTEEVCLDHAEAKLRELVKETKYQYAMIRCVRVKGLNT